MKKALVRPATWLNLALLLALALTLPEPALGLAAVRANEPVQTEGASQAIAGGESQDALAPEGIDCSKPLPGRTTTLGVDDEILITVEKSIQEMGIAKYDNKSDTDASL